MPKQRRTNEIRFSQAWLSGLLRLNHVDRCSCVHGYGNKSSAMPMNSKGLIPDNLLAEAQ